MAIGLMNRIWWREDLDSSEKLVLLSLADRADDEGVCWYAVSTIARKASMSDRGVQKVIARLCDAGLLRKVQRRDRSNFYIIPVDKFPEQQIAKPAKETGALEWVEEQEDLFGGRGERGSPVRGERGSGTGERGSPRGEPGAPDSLDDSLIDSQPDAHTREGGEETLQEMVARRWNELAAEQPALAPVRSQLSETRRKAIDARTKEWANADSADDLPTPDRAFRLWANVFETIARSKLLTGQKTDWAPSLDWVLGPKNFTKIMEGHYGHGHDRIGAVTNDPAQRSAVAAGREARDLVERSRERAKTQRSGGYSAGASHAH